MLSDIFLIFKDIIYIITILMYVVERILNSFKIRNDRKMKDKNILSNTVYSMKKKCILKDLK